VSCVGRVAARRNAPKQPRAIRVGPHQGRGKVGLNTGGLSVFFHDSGGLPVFFFHDTGGLSPDYPQNVKVNSDKPLV